MDNQSDVARLSLIGVSPWADLTERTHWVRITAYSLTGREVVHPPGKSPVTEEPHT